VETSTEPRRCLSSVVGEKADQVPLLDVPPWSMGLPGGGTQRGTSLRLSRRRGTPFLVDGRDGTIVGAFGIYGWSAVKPTRRMARRKAH